MSLTIFQPPTSVVNTEDLPFHGKVFRTKSIAIDMSTKVKPISHRRVLLKARAKRRRGAEAAIRALETRRTPTVMSMLRARPTDDALARQLRIIDAAKHKSFRRILDLVSETQRRAQGPTPIITKQPTTRILGPRVRVGPNRDTIPRERPRTNHDQEVQCRVTLLEEDMLEILPQILVPVTVGQRLDVLQIWLSTLECLQLPDIPHDKDAMSLVDMSTRLGHDHEWILDDNNHTTGF